MDLAAGIDFGLRTYKLAVTDGTTVLGTKCIDNACGRASDIIAEALTDLAEESGTPLSRIRMSLATGNVPKFAFSGGQVGELDCMARGVLFLAPQAHTVINFGASKVIVAKCSDGEVLKWARNDKCGAGSGLFLDAVKQLLQVDFDDFNENGAEPSEYLEVENTCAVFAESEIISLLHMGRRPKDIAYAVLRGCAERVYSLVRAVAWEPELVMIGGGARNKGLVAAIKKLVGAPIGVPRQGEFASAVGAAMMAAVRIQEDG